MKMTWLHKFLGLFFIPADSRAKSTDFDGAAIPPPIFSMAGLNLRLILSLLYGHFSTVLPASMTCCAT